MTEELKQEESVEQQETVDAKVYKNVQSDMMKYKAEKREAQERLAQLEAQLRQREEAELMEKQEWEKVAKLKDQQLQELQNQQKQSQELLVNTHKIAAVTAAVGGFVKPQYAKTFTNVENIAMIDGVIDDATLQAEVERLRRDHPELLKSSVKVLPNNAPAKANEINKSYNDMSKSEKDELRRRLIIENAK